MVWDLFSGQMFLCSSVASQSRWAFQTNPLPKATLAKTPLVMLAGFVLAIWIKRLLRFVFFVFVFMIYIKKNNNSVFTSTRIKNHMFHLDLFLFHVVQPWVPSCQTRGGFGQFSPACPDGPDCIGPGGTVFTNSRRRNFYRSNSLVIWVTIVCFLGMSGVRLWDYVDDMM